MDTVIALLHALGRDYVQGFLLGCALGSIITIFIRDKTFNKRLDRERQALQAQHNKDMDRMIHILSKFDEKRSTQELQDTLEKVWHK